MDNQSHSIDVPSPGSIDPIAQHPPKYISLTNRHFHRHSRGYRSADWCQRFICCSCTFLFFLILLFLLAFAVTYTILNPKLPKFKVSSIAVDSLDVNPANPIISAEFAAFIEADNPNKRLGFWYRDEGTVSASFRGVKLCTGPVQQFLQPGNNITLMKIDMKGQSEEAEPGGRAALLEGIAGPPRQEALELRIIARVPVSVLLDNAATIWKFRVDVVFSLMLNSIAPGRPIQIESSKQHVEVDFMDWM